MSLCICDVNMRGLLMQWMVDIPGLPRAPKLVVAALLVGRVTILYLRMAARIVQATQQAHATHKRVQVRIVWVNALGCLCCSSLHWILRCANEIGLVFAHVNTCSRSSVHTHPKVMTSLTCIHLSFCR